MIPVQIGNINVEFPFQPYPVQTAFMEKVIEALRKGIHAVLESPTGTGKTASLLCSTLAWVRNENMKTASISNMPSQPNYIDDPEEALVTVWGAQPCRKRVIYCSRTHSQLQKAMQELQATPYKNVKATILGSRDQLCIHPVVSKESSLSVKNALCAMHVKAKSCHYNNQVDAAIKDPALINGVVDIEDLIKFGKKKSCCPYYLARDLQGNADIIFMPYNYLLEPQIRNKLNINLNSTIVILDEGHNVDKVCEESSSITLTSSDLAVALEDLTKEMNDIYEESSGNDIPIEKKYSNDDLCNVKQTLLNLEEQFDSFPLKPIESQNTYPGSCMYTLLSKAQINYETSNYYISLLKSLQEVLQYKEASTSNRGNALRKIAETLELLFSVKEHNINLYFKTYIEREKPQETDRPSWSTIKVKNPNAKKINFWCFHPGFAIKNLLALGVYSLIITSGTLAPVSATVQELGLENAIILESPHVIDESQVSVSVLTKGPNNFELRSSYANRDNQEYWTSIGLTLQNFLRIIPDGVLVFFPSYSALKKAVDNWKSSGLWGRLVLTKPIFVEEAGKGTFNSLMEEFKSSVNNGKGAVLIGVCRGKLAEGMDFSDNYGRAVFIFGLPYPPVYDPKVTLKKQYLSSNRAITELTGDMWYQLEATRAVNQAIGRVIRHINDFGVVVLCDIKFTRPNIINNLSKWMVPLISTAHTFGDSIRIVRQFFKHNVSRMTTIQTQIQQNNIPGCSQSFGNYFCQHNYPDLSRYKEDRRCQPTTSQKFNVTPYTSYTQSSSNTSSNPLPLQEDRRCQPTTSQMFNVTPYTSYTQSSSNTSSNPLPLQEDRRCQPTTSQMFNVTPYTSYTQSSSNTSSNPLPLPIMERKPKPTLSCLAAMKQAEEEAANARKLQTPRSLHLIGEFNREIKQPAKRRKIAVAPLMVGDIRADSCDPVVKEKVKKINYAKNFILEMKNTLEEESYAQFDMVIRNFHKDHNLDELISKLAVLFPAEDPYFRDVFRDCSKILCGKNLEAFQKYCDEKYPV